VFNFLKISLLLLALIEDWYSYDAMFNRSTYWWSKPEYLLLSFSTFSKNLRSFFSLGSIRSSQLLEMRIHWGDHCYSLFTNLVVQSRGQKPRAFVSLNMVNNLHETYPDPIWTFDTSHHSRSFSRYDSVLYELCAS
jgi:hypothetical protein